MSDSVPQGAIKSAELLAEAVMDTVHESLLVLDSQFRVRLANRNFYRTFRVDIATTANQLIFELGDGQWNVPDLRKLLEQVLPERKYFEGLEITRDFPGIGYKTMLLNARKLERMEDQEDLILLAIDDITERKASENAIRRSNGELASFAYTASHDLQAPLRSIKLFTQMLVRRSRGHLDDEGEKLVGFIEKGIGSMEDLILSLLNYSLATEPEPGGKQSVSLQEAFDKATVNLAETIERESATVTSEPLPDVDAYPTQIVQILQNLISNAIKYHKADVPPVVCVAVVQAKDHWVVSVVDNGVGIDPKHHAQIWEPFKRLHGVEVPGTGIGLATCSKIAEHHGGTIWLESELGVGSTFYFSISK
jgi:two-component system, chemotaxis family, CheB/CheR fusion protein